MNKNTSKKHISNKEWSNLSINSPKTINKINKKKKSPQFKLSTEKIINHCYPQISVIKTIKQRSQYNSSPKKYIKLSPSKRNSSTTRNIQETDLSKYQNDYYPQPKKEEKKLKSSYSTTIKSTQLSKYQKSATKKQIQKPEKKINHGIQALKDQYQLYEFWIKKTESVLQRYKTKLVNLLKKNVKLQKEYKFIKSKLQQKNLKKRVQITKNLY